MKLATRTLCTLVFLISLFAVTSTARAQTYMYLERMGQPYNEQCSGVPCGEWNTPLPTTNTDVDPNSAAIVSVMDQWFYPGPANDRPNFGIAGGFNWWIAPPGTPLVTVTLTNNFHAGLQNVLNQVPIPEGAHPSNDSDARMAILQPTSKCEWEFWHLSDTPSGWQASTGGRTCDIFNAQGVYKNVVDSQGYTLEGNNWGGPATGFTSMAGAMMVDEISHGFIPHAIAFAVSMSANCSGEWNLPAERTDGQATPSPAYPAEPTNCVPEGAVFRLPPPCPTGQSSTVGVCFNLSDLSGDPIIVQELAQAAQDYGLIDENSTSGGTIPVESGDSSTNVYAYLGGDPYTQQLPNEPNTPFLGICGQSTCGNQNDLQLFPWPYLELTTLHLTQSPDNNTYTGVDPPAPLYPYPN